MSQTNHSQELEHVTKETAAALDQHAKNLRLYFKGQDKGKAEHFAYAYLVGRELLATKGTIGHGNTNGDTNAGLKRFIAAEFPDRPYSTCTFWMQYAKMLADTAASLPEFKKTPLLLGNGKKLSMKERTLIVDLVPRVMDGKGMREFMRHSRMLRDAEKPKHHPRKSVDPDKAAAAKRKQAESFFKGILADLQLAEDHLKHLETVTLQSTLDHLIDVSNHIRELIKNRKGTKQ